MFLFFVGDLLRIGLHKGHGEGNFAASGYRAGTGSDQGRTKPVARSRTQIELGFEVFEVQGEF